MTILSKEGFFKVLEVKYFTNLCYFILFKNNYSWIKCCKFIYIIVIIEMVSCCYKIIDKFASFLVFAPLSKLRPGQPPLSPHPSYGPDYLVHYSDIYLNSGWNCCLIQRSNHLNNILFSHLNPGLISNSDPHCSS